MGLIGYSPADGDFLTHPENRMTATMLTDKRLFSILIIFNIQISVTFCIRLTP
jgi:hypothetical protein